jgi:hypothetical protein
MLHELAAKNQRQGEDNMEVVGGQPLEAESWGLESYREAVSYILLLSCTKAFANHVKIAKRYLQKRMPFTG